MGNQVYGCWTCCWTESGLLKRSRRRVWEDGRREGRENKSGGQRIESVYGERGRGRSTGSLEGRRDWEIVVHGMGMEKGQK